jgi:hypothetical protein
MMNSAVVIEFGTKTLSHARDRDKPSALPLPLNLRLIRPRVMKQILLCVTAMVPKVSLCERSKPSGVQFSRPGKIVFAQHPLNPDVDRERAQPLVGKEHYTISNLRAYARQLAQPRPKIDIGERRQLLQIDISARDQPRRCQ